MARPYWLLVVTGAVAAVLVLTVNSDESNASSSGLALQETDALVGVGESLLIFSRSDAAIESVVVVSGSESLDVSAHVTAGAVKESRSAGSGAWKTGEFLFDSLVSTRWLDPQHLAVSCMGEGEGQVIVGLSVPGRFFAARSLDFSSDSPTRIDLRPARPVAIRVSDQEGRPVSGARVIARTAFDEQWTGLSPSERLCDQAFRFEARSSSEGMSVVEYPLERPMMVFAEDEVSGARGVAWGVRAGDEVTIALAESFSVLVEVDDEGGRPVAGATVALFAGGVAGEDLVDASQTGTEGSASLRAPTRERSVALLVAKEGFAPEVIQVSRPSAGAPASARVTLAGAQFQRLHVLTQDRRPLIGAEVELVYPSGAWVPGSFRVDETGQVRPDVYLRGDAEVEAVLWSGGLRVGAWRIQVSESQEVTEVIATGVARITEVLTPKELEADLTRIEVIGPAGLAAGSTAWELPGESPWLTTGDNRLVCYWSDGVVSESSVRISESGPVLLSRETATLRLVGLSGLPADARYVLHAVGGPRVATGSTVSPSVELAVAQGDYVLRLLDGAGGLLGETGEIAVGDGGLVLDVGGLCQSGSIFGLVCDDFGLPIRGVLVQLIRADGWFTGIAVSSDSGGFEFFGLAPGIYAIEVDAEGLGQVGDRLLRTVALRPGESVGPVKIGLAGDAPVVVLIRGDVPRDATAFVAGSQFVAFSRVGEAGEARFHVADSPRYFGLVGYDGSSLVLGVGASAFGEAVELDMRVCRAVEMGVRDTSGRAVPRASARFRIPTGQLAGPTAFSGHDGAIRVVVAESSLGELIVSAPGYLPATIRIGELTQSRDVVLSPVPMSPTLVVDLSGQPVQGAVVVEVDTGRVVQTNLRGECLAAGRRRIEAIDFASAEFGPEVTIARLRRLCSGIFLRVPVAGVEGLLVEAMFPGGPEPRRGRPSGEGGAEWLLGDMPEGTYRVTCFDLAGRVMEAFTIQLRPGQYSPQD